MNPFEIKTTKQSITNLGLIEIYDLTKLGAKINPIGIDVVIEFEYAKRRYLAKCVFTGTYGNKIETIRQRIIKQRNSIDAILYKEQTYSKYILDDFITEQIKATLLKNGKENKRENWENWLWDIIRKFEDEPRDIIGIYDKYLEMGIKKALQN